MTTLYSNKARGFFPADMQAAYEAAGTWPADGVEVTPEDEAKLRAAIAAGATIRKKSGGKWDITAPPPLPFAVLAAPYLASVRQTRDAILNRLAGIGFAAMADGDAGNGELHAWVELDHQWPGMFRAVPLGAIEAVKKAAAPVGCPA